MFPYPVLAKKQQVWLKLDTEAMRAGRENNEQKAKEATTMTTTRRSADRRQPAVGPAVAAGDAEILETVLRMDGSEGVEVLSRVALFTTDLPCKFEIDVTGTGTQIGYVSESPWGAYHRVKVRGIWFNFCGYPGRKKRRWSISHDPIAKTATLVIVGIVEVRSRVISGDTNEMNAVGGQIEAYYVNIRCSEESAAFVMSVVDRSETRSGLGLKNSAYITPLDRGAEDQGRVVIRERSDESRLPLPMAVAQFRPAPVRPHHISAAIAAKITGESPERRLVARAEAAEGSPKGNMPTPRSRRPFMP